jgi:uncharacterized repeat protein (TIGR01451 family)
MRMKLKKAIQLIAIIMIGIFMVATVLVFAHKSADRVLANGPIPPPVGYPKLTLSTKVVTPTLAKTDGAVLEYRLEILNTGAYPASDVTLTDTIPANTVYNNDAQSSALPNPSFKDGVISWEHGAVGFDDSEVITFSVTVTPGYEGIISNTAVISDPLIAAPVTVKAETRITDHPLFEIAKSATPALPGKNKPLTYELVVTNVGQDAVNTPINVTDFIPADTTFQNNASPGFSYDPIGKAVTWNPFVNLAFGETTAFTFSVEIGDVPSGTVIQNSTYSVNSEDGFGVGEPYTTTVVDPIFILSKSIIPDPPGSNNEMTYTLTVLNLGSMATDLVITDTVPADVEYLRGGDSYKDGIVTWHLPSLDTRESEQVTFTVYIADIADIIVVNDDYAVCSAEGVCAPGIPVPSYIVGPTFEVTASLDPIAHKPGGGVDVTPTLTIKNLGPGNALDATALITFGRISVSNVDVLKVIPPDIGTFAEGPPCTIWPNCLNYVWTGNLAVGNLITITTIEGQSTIGGEEGTHYTATVVVTDDLSGYVTEPITATAIGHITHMSNLIPTKSAPPQIGPGQTMTYTIQVFDSGLSTEAPPVLTETVPASVTLLTISDGGISQTIDGQTMISWTLPAMGPGDYLYRSFGVLVHPDLVSGTLIVNDDYLTSVYESFIKEIKTIPGEPITTTVHEVGLIDSYKTVTPTWALPGTGTVLTYVVHVVNSGPNTLSDVQVNDIFPWENSTYQRDAAVDSGSLVSDIVSLEWTGDIAAYSEKLITFTTLVDDFFEGVLTNTATITHTSLKQPVDVSAVAYITDKPVLRISKAATPDPVTVGSPLLYQIQVTNLGQQATRLVVTDTIPANTSYITGTASSGGLENHNVIQWNLPVLEPGETLNLAFQVTVQGGINIINDSYKVSCDEGVSAFGEPVITRVKYPGEMLLPIVFKN